MAQTNYTPIQLYYSTTAAAVPVNTNLLNGELAINITDGKLYYKDNSGTVQVIATKGAGTIGGSTTQIQYNNAGALAGSSAMTFNNSTNVVTLTTLNLTNALGAIYGGTGLSTYTTGDLLYSSASNTLAKLAIGTANYILTVNSGGTNVQWSAPSSISVSTATNLAGGVAGSVPYQSGASTTTFLGIGAADRVMTSSGSAPQWVTALTGLTGVSSSSITNTSLTSGRVVYSGTGGLQTNSANLTFDGTTLTTAGLSNSGTSGLVKLVTVGGTSFTGTTAFVPATPAKFYLSTGTVTDNTTGAGGTQTYGAIMSLGITPIAATLAGVTYTNAATLYIDGAPSNGANVLITNPYALYVAAGKSYFGGNVGVNTTSTTFGLTVGSGLYITNSATLPAATPPLLFSYESPVGRIYVGDGTGYSVAFSKRISSTTTDLVTLTDGGNLSIGQTSTQGARFSVYGGALASASSGLAISSALTAGRLTSGDTNNATAYIGNFLDLSITELSAGSSPSLTSGIVAFGGTAAVNPNTVKTYTAGTVRTTVDASGNFGVDVLPTAKLDVNKLANDTITRANAAGAFGDLFTLGAGLLMQQKVSSPYGFALQAANAANSFQFPLLLNPSGGNVGIGTSSPSYKLDASGTGAIAARITGTTNASLILNNANSYYAYFQYNTGGTANGLMFYDTTNSSDRAFLDASGNFSLISGALGVGLNPPTYPIHVKKDGQATGVTSVYTIGRFLNNAQSKGVDLGYNSTNNQATLIAYSGGTASGYEFYAYNGSAWYLPFYSVASTGRFTATYGIYADPSLASSGSTGFNIITSATYNDSSSHFVVQAQNMMGVR
jgi:hypothetical protein